MSVFHLFRIKIERSAQPSLFEDKTKSARDLILDSIQEKPSHETRKDQIWRIGNIEEILSDGLLFAFGKVTKSKREVYDEANGNFRAEDQDEGPHTYVSIDLHNQVCAIAHKPKIAPYVKNIAGNLAKLLDESKTAKEHHIKFAITAISDPDAFIELIRNAELITQFEMTFTPPNPFDVEEQFHKPMENLVQATNATDGLTRIKGQNLDSGVLEDLTRSAAAAGNEAKARIQSPGDQKPVTKYLAGNPITVAVEDLVTHEDKLGLLERIRQSYRRVRGTDDAK